MLFPINFTIIDIKEAKLLKDFIDQQTRTKTIFPHYKKMQKLGVLKIYVKLKEFIEYHDHYEQELRYLDTSRYIN